MNSSIVSLLKIISFKFLIKNNFFICSEVLHNSTNRNLLICSDKMGGIKEIIMAIKMAAMFLECALAENITVGGSTGWDLATNFTQLSSSTPIFVNDFLVFNYSQAHNVIEVSKIGFATCSTSSPLRAYNNGANTVIPLTHSGPRYFICARSNYCSLGFKLQVHVLDHPDQTSIQQPNHTEPSPQKSGSCRDTITAVLFFITLVTTLHLFHIVTST